MNIAYTKVSENDDIEVIIAKINDLIEIALTNPKFDISKAELKSALCEDDFVTNSITIIITQENG